MKKNKAILKVIRDIILLLSLPLLFILSGIFYWEHTRMVLLFILIEAWILIIIGVVGYFIYDPIMDRYDKYLSEG